LPVRFATSGSECPKRIALVTVSLLEK